MRGSTNKSPIKLSMQRKINNTVICLWIGKSTRQKPHRVILRSPLPKLHYYCNKQLQVKESQYLIPTYSQTLTPIPNWTCSVVTTSAFDAWIPIRDFNHQLEKVVGYKVLQFIHMMKIKKMLSHKTLQCSYTATSSKEMN